MQHLAIELIGLPMMEGRRGPNYIEAEATFKDKAMADAYRESIEKTCRVKGEARVANDGSSAIVYRIPDEDATIVFGYGAKCGALVRLYDRMRA